MKRGRTEVRTKSDKWCPFCETQIPASEEQAHKAHHVDDGMLTEAGVLTTGSVGRIHYKETEKGRRAALAFYRKLWALREARGADDERATDDNPTEGEERDPG